MSEPTEFVHPDAMVRLVELDHGRRRLLIEPRRPDIYIHRRVWETSYPDELIRLVLEVKGPGFVCDEIMREEDPTYIRPHLELTIKAHVDPGRLAGQRVLDFGCGSGASTVILGQLLPDSEIVGVELSPGNLAIARKRAEFRGLARVRFLQSPRGDQLPPGLGRFGAVVLSAVFEHLLPAERRLLSPMLWELLEPGGILFVDETPARWFPLETHTTGLPLINYLPDGAAHFIARRCSRRNLRDQSWQTMLRNGIRGASPGEILSVLPAQYGRPHVLRPCRERVRNRVDLWYRGYARPGTGVKAALKRRSLLLFRLASALVGSPLVPYLSLAIQKDDRPAPGGTGLTGAESGQERGKAPGAAGTAMVLGTGNEEAVL
jgi:2-polyprenyl-3-methyl-5-hydroxy-6-metoxy-1,4-benzoquinol methylase